MEEKKKKSIHKVLIKDQNFRLPNDKLNRDQELKCHFISHESGLAVSQSDSYVRKRYTSQRSQIMNRVVRKNES